MSSVPAIASVAVPRERPLLRLCALLAALAVAGCGQGGLSSPAGGGATPVTVASAVPVPVASAAPVAETSQAPTDAQTRPPTEAPTDVPTGPPTEAPTPDPTEQPGLPTATLVAGGGAPMRGQLGSYVWDGAGSDAPWLVPPGDEAVRSRGPYAVTVTPLLAVERWKASWAPVVAGSVRDPIGNVGGDGGLVLVPGPGAVGTWSLGVDIRFADGNHAAWYWRVEVLP